MEAPPAIPSYEKRFAAPRCSANVGWISRRRNPTFEWGGSVAVLGGGVQPVRGKRRKRLWRFHHTESDPPYRDTDPPQEIGVAASNSRTPRTKARRLVCNGGYSRFAVNDGLRFANPSYELFRLTALGGGCSRFAVNDGSAFGDSIIRKVIRHTAMSSNARRAIAQKDPALGRVSGGQVEECNRSGYIRLQVSVTCNS